jgi:hypothetical protein
MMPRLSIILANERPSLSYLLIDLRVKGSLNVLLRKGLGRWIGDWMLGMFIVLVEGNVRCYLDNQ